MSTFRRLLGFLGPYRRSLYWSLAIASVAMGMTVLIPALIGNAINAIQEGRRTDLLPLAGAIVGAGVFRLALTFNRRIVAGKVSLAVEFDLRSRVYRHLQALELGFFDSQQTGQLMSRATVDLQSIRFFLGYGVIFLTQNLLTILLAGGVMIAMQPGLAMLALIPVPIVVWTASRYNRYSRPALQEVQQRIAELTAEAEESVSGVRVVKAFSREQHMLARFRRSVIRVFDQNLYSTKLRAFYNPLIGFLPNLGLAVVLLDRRQPGDQRHPEPRRLHRLLHLRHHAHRADADARRRARDGPARDRLRQPPVRDPRPRAADREPSPARRRCPTGDGRIEIRRRLARLRGRFGGRAERRRPRRRSRPRRRARRPDRLGQDEPRRAARPALRPDGGERPRSTAPTSATSISPRCATRSPSSPTTASCSAPRSPRTSPTPIPRPIAEEIELAARRAQAASFIDAAARRLRDRWSASAA